MVFVSLDTLRQDRVGAYGYARPITPALDAFADKGTIFLNSYAQSSSTLPTHASIFTSRWPQQHQSFGQERALHEDELTLAEVLRDAGYDTWAGVSSRRFILPLNLDQGFERYARYWWFEKSARSVRLNKDFLRIARQSKDRPVFAFLHYFDAHAPYDPPEPYPETFTTVREDIRPDDTADFIARYRYARLSDEKLTYLKDLYDGGIVYLDHHLEELFTETRFSNGRPTLWIITADHGEAFSEHRYLGHSRKVYEELLHVPLIMVWEGVIPAGQRSPALAQSVDLFPTILELLSLEAPEGLMGRSLAGPLRGEIQPSDERIPGALDVIPILDLPDVWGMIATLPGEGRLKIIQHRDEALKLYLLDHDPAERRNMVRRKPELQERMVHIADSVGLPALKPFTVRSEGAREVSAREIDMLRELGYIDEADDIER